MTEVMPGSKVRAAALPVPQHGRVKRCGHCRAGHCGSCKGAVRVPPGKSAPTGLVVCLCPNCEPQLRCLDCGNQFAEDVNPKKWACLSRTACAARVAQRQHNSRLWRMIQDAKSAGARARRLDRERRERVRDAVGPEVEDRAASRTPRPTSGTCACCGAPTKGGQFAPGHDARYKSMLKKKANAGDKEAYRQLVERGWIAA